ncbi:MAG: hypothetical protein KAT58_02520 [candidate division Zixibacteria bacterium]|nr:hypothetical protein [candidate division Zixibacteria bacterium]
MRKLSVLFLLVALLLPQVAVAQDGGGAKVYMDKKERVFDYGWAPSGSAISHSYFLFSRGTDSLRILKVRPG